MYALKKIKTISKLFSKKCYIQEKLFKIKIIILFYLLFNLFFTKDLLEIVKDLLIVLF